MQFIELTTAIADRVSVNATGYDGCYIAEQRRFGRYFLDYCVSSEQISDRISGMRSTYNVTSNLNIEKESKRITSKGNGIRRKKREREKVRGRERDLRFESTGLHLVK